MERNYKDDGSSTRMNRLEINENENKKHNKMFLLFSLNVMHQFFTAVNWLLA
jgi:hypothetical protein